MVRVLHRTAPNRERELRERAWALAEQRLGGKIICSHCHATVKNYAERCCMDDDEDCPGEAAWKNAFDSALADVRRA